MESMKERTGGTVMQAEGKVTGDPIRKAEGKVLSAYGRLKDKRAMAIVLAAGMIIIVIAIARARR